jgi:hypothetical protein
MGVPARTLLGFFMDNDARAWWVHWWVHWCLIEVIMAIKLGIRRYFRVEAGLSHKVESYSRLW